MPISDTATFIWHGKPVTVTRDVYDSFTPAEQTSADQEYVMSQGKVIGTAPGGNFWKRWRGMFGEPKGYEFRPLRHADYGYPDDFQFQLSTAVWILETIGTFNVGLREGAVVLATSMLLNEYVLPSFKSPVSGSSFVWNIQGGFNVYHYMWGKGKTNPWVKWSAFGVFGTDLFAMLVEQYQDHEFNTMIAHDLHGAGLGIGLVCGALLSKMM